MAAETAPPTIHSWLNGPTARRSNPTVIRSSPATRTALITAKISSCTVKSSNGATVR